MAGTGLAKVINLPEQGPPPLDLEQGSEFGWYERMFLTWRDGKVFDYGDWAARDIQEALGRDYKMVQLDQVITGPIEAAEATITPIKGDTGEAEWADEFFKADEFSGGMDTPLDLVKAQMTSAALYRKAYFEKVWTAGTGDFDGKVVYKRIAFRPASTCRTMRTPQGKLLGFEQDPWYLGEISGSTMLEPIEIPLNRAMIHVHGQRRDPVNGVSDMEVPYWCYKTKQKVLFLWLQYAEQASLPRVVVKAQELGIAQAAAREIARMKNSGVLPVASPQGPEGLGVETLDISGKGGEQFMAIISWLDQAAANANVAGFTQLTDYQKSGGSWALSTDASDFYLQRLESKTREMEREIRRQILAPLIRYNFGLNSKVPQYQLAPLNTEDITPQVEMLSKLLGSRDPSLVPGEFIEEVATMVCDKWGIDPAKMRSAFQSAQHRAEEQAMQQRALATQIGQPKQPGAGVTPAKPPGVQVAGVAAAVNEIGRQAKVAQAKG